MKKVLFSYMMTPELRERLEALADRVQLRVKRDESFRPARLTELLTLAAETLAHRLETGQDALAGSASFHGAKQILYRGSKRVAEIRAPLASRGVYEELARSPRIPTQEEMELLEEDASLLTKGQDVHIRGSLFSDPKRESPGVLPVGRVGRIVTLRERGETHVRIPGVQEVFQIHPYDMIPAEMVDPT